MDRETLSEQFKRYLEAMPEAQWAQLQEPQTDLHALFVELSGLRTEVKSETRLMKSSLDDFKGVYDTLCNSQQRLESDLERSRNALQTQRTDLLRPLLLSWLAIRDRLAATLEGLEAMRPTGWTASFRKRRCQLIDQIQQGQRITLSHFDDTLASYSVYPLNAIGKPFDPHQMRVVETRCAPDRADGEVLAEQRTGFTWESQLLRYADVIVNRPENKGTS